MLGSQIRNTYFSSLLTPRLDSRFLLQVLITFNIVLVLYYINRVHSKARACNSNQCIVVINTSKDSSIIQNTNSKSESDGSLDNSSLNTKDINQQINEFNGKSDKLSDKQYIDLNRNQLNTKNEIISETIWWSTEIRGYYSVLNNYILSDERPDSLKSVTLTTQGTFPFLHHIENLCNRWDGHISVAVYAPGDDFALAVNLIYYLRKCRDICVKAKTSWHLVYNTEFGPKSNQTFPNSFVKQFQCSQSYDDIITKFNTSFRADHSLPYPINVVRNVARLNSETKYLFASDIELYPSAGIVSGFMQLLEREKSKSIPMLSNISSRHVYVIPIFEVKVGVKPPIYKSELIALMKLGKAIFFHKLVCDHCQNFPDRNKWIDVKPVNNTLGIFRVTRRERSRKSWEPLFIGTNDEPFYEERLTWNGKRDKMSQMYEMCLMGYTLAILDNAFLVHSPGIKHIDPKEEEKRIPFYYRNRLVYKTIYSKLWKKFGTENNC